MVVYTNAVHTAHRGCSEYKSIYIDLCGEPSKRCINLVGCGPHKNQDDTEEKPTGERMMRVKVLDEKVRGEVETQKGGDTKKEKPALPPHLFQNSFHSSTWKTHYKNHGFFCSHYSYFKNN